METLKLKDVKRIRMAINLINMNKKKDLKMTTLRLNKTNIPEITEYIIERFNYKSKNRKDAKKNYISIVDVWDVEAELQDKFNISDNASQKIVQLATNWTARLTVRK